jgi:predicted Zn-dependent protease
VYLVRHGDTLQHALKGQSIFDYALAAVIWHEMAHIEGAHEREVQQMEETLWKRYLLERRVDTARGLRYLALLEKRH